MQGTDLIAETFANSSVAGLITAIGSLLTALAVLVTAVALLLSNRKVRVRVEQNSTKVDEVHVIVNQQRTDQKRYIKALTNALHAAGIEVPDDQSIE